MAKSKINRKLVALGGLSIVVITGVVIVMFVPLSALGFTDERLPEQIIEDTIDQAEIDGFEIEFCNDIICPDNIQIQNKTLIDEIIDPIEEGIQETDPEVIINEEDKEIIIEKGIEQPPAEIIPEIIPEKEPSVVEIISNVTKIDNTGERFRSSTSFNLPLFGLFVEDTTNKNFDQGFIENQFFVKTDPNLNIELNGFFDILIDNQTILTNPVTINVQGISDQDGMISINFLSPSGLPSESFLFQFNDHIDKFSTSGLTKIEYKLSDVSANIDDFSYLLSSETIFEMDIFTDINLITIMNEEGQTVRVFPTDTTVKVSSSARNWKYTVGQGCKIIQNQRICGQYITYKASVPAPAMGGGEVFHILKDGTQESVTTFPATTGGTCSSTNRGTSCSSIALLPAFAIQRDEIYKIDFASPNAGSVMFKTPITKTSYSFSCVNLDNTRTVSNIVCNYNDPATKESLLATLEEP